MSSPVLTRLRFCCTGATPPFNRKLAAVANLMNDPERSESCRVDSVRNREALVALIASDSRLSERTHCAVNGVGVIPALLQRSLNTGDDLVGREAALAVDRLVVLIIRIGIVAPRRGPPAVVPAPPAPVDEDEGETMAPPPIVIVMIVAMIRVVPLRLIGAGDIAVPMAKTRGGL